MNSDDHNNDAAQRSTIRQAIVGFIDAGGAYYRSKADNVERPSSFDVGFWTMVAAIGSSIAALLAFLTALLFYSQLATMKQQLKDAEIQQAASLSVQNLTVSGFPDHPVVDFDVKNSGPTRADWVTADPEYLWTGRDGFMQLMDKGFGGRAQASNLGFSVGPSETKHFTVPMDIAIPKEMAGLKDIPANMRAKLASREDIIAGKMWGVYAVDVTYKDIFGNIAHVSNCIVHTDQGFRNCFAENRHS